MASLINIVMKTIRILILEDDLKTLSVITDKLFELEERLFDDNIDFAVTVFSEYTEVEEYLNKKGSNKFDIILLDKDCKLTGSFHCLDFDKFDLNKIIAISSVAQYNKELEKIGIKKVCRKDFANMNQFGDDIIKEIIKMI
jgi:hypothetical protein